MLGAEGIVIMTWDLSQCGMGEINISERLLSYGNCMRHTLLGIIKNLPTFSNIPKQQMYQTPDNQDKKGKSEI